MGRKIVVTEAKHQSFVDELKEVLKKHGQELSGLELLAITSHLVGTVIALQDKFTVTPMQAMDIVRRNIELGNAEGIKTFNQGLH